MSVFVMYRNKVYTLAPLSHRIDQQLGAEDYAAEKLCSHYLYSRLVLLQPPAVGLTDGLCPFYRGGGWVRGEESL